MEHSYKETYPVGWIILLEEDKPFRPPRPGKYGETVPPRIYPSYLKAKAVAKKFHVTDPIFVPIYYNLDDLVYKEHMGCPNWPNCDVVGCH